MKSATATGRVPVRDARLTTATTRAGWHRGKSVPILPKFLFGQARSIGRIGRVSVGAGALREMANGNPIAHHRPPALSPAPVFWHRNDLIGFAGIIAGDWII